MQTLRANTERTWKYGRLLLGALAIAAVGRFAQYPLPTLAALGVVSLLIFSACCAVDGLIRTNAGEEERTKSVVGALLSLMVATALGGFVWLLCVTGAMGFGELLKM